MDPQLFLHATPPEPRLVYSVRNDAGWVAEQPAGGFWTSSYLGSRLGSTFVQSWPLSRGRNNCWLLALAPDARVVTINGPDDLNALAAHYGTTPSGLSLDFENMARHVDGVHLTERGAQKCLKSWELESTLWFRWSFTYVTSLGMDQFPRFSPRDPLGLLDGDHLMHLFTQELARGGNEEHRQWWG